MKDDDIAIKVNGVSKAFKLPHEKQNSVKGLFVNMFRGKRTFERQQVLKDISFDIKKGEFFGIVGRNGSGKSTLLKLMAGIYTPDKGHIQVNGKLTPFIELGVGFNPELTGRENVFLNGALLGFNRKEMEAMYDEIVAFAELESFMDQKLKNYSSGMQVRLAFSIAIRANTDILVLDEVLAVGDEAFQRKCFAYFAKLKQEKKTVILVTHSMDNVTRFCDRAMMLDRGAISSIGSVKKVSDTYILSNMTSTKDTKESVANKTNVNNEFADCRISVRNQSKKTKKVFSKTDEDKIIYIDTSLTVKKDINRPSFLSVIIKNSNGQAVMRTASEDFKVYDNVFKSHKKGDKVSMSLAIQNIFGEGEYYVAVSFKSIDRSEVYIESLDKSTFSIEGLGVNGYSLRPDIKMEIIKNE